MSSQRSLRRLDRPAAGPPPVAGSAVTTLTGRAERLVSWLVLLLLAGCVVLAVYDLYLLVADVR